MRLGILTAILALADSAAVHAQSYQGSLSPAIYAPSSHQSRGVNPLTIPVHDGWSFVGCVSSHHHCGHHASEHGFHHHTVRHSHDSCPSHPHLACFGRN